MLKILFMGTPDFAARCLERLVDEGRNVVGVITQPDKAKGRGMKTAFSDVKKYALEKKLTVYQPQTLKDGAIAELLGQLCPDIIIVVAYGKILPEYVLRYPKYGCINVHGSLLPKYRGAAPIQRAVMNGEKITGVTTMFMDKGLDTGDILLSREYEIGENETTGEVFDGLALLGAQLLSETIDGLESKSITATRQDESKATYTEKITNEECGIDFSDDAQAVHNKIRGLSPFPGAFCYLDGKIVKLYESSVVPCEDGIGAGSVARLTKDEIIVRCGKNAVSLTKLKPEGKGIMNARDLINGRKVTPESVFKTSKD